MNTKEYIKEIVKLTTKDLRPVDVKLREMMELVKIPVPEKAYELNINSHDQHMITSVQEPALQMVKDLQIYLDTETVPKPIVSKIFTNFEDGRVYVY